MTSTSMSPVPRAGVPRVAFRCRTRGHPGEGERANVIWILTYQLSILGAMTTFALTELLGAPVFVTGGSRCGRVRELALIPQEDRARIAVLIVKTGSGNRMLPFRAVTSIAGGFRTDMPATDWAQGDCSEGMLLLSRDLLDQQVIDVFGRKVVRVNDLDLNQEFVESRPVLKVGSVDVVPRGAVR